MSYRKIIVHYNSNTEPNVPSGLTSGEISVDYHDGNERIYIKNDNNEIVPFISLDEINQKYQKKPVVIYETDGTTGLLGVNASTMSDAGWQLTDLDLTPYTHIKCYFKQSNLAIANNNYLAPSIVVEVPLNTATASKGSSVCNMYLGAQTTLLPDNRNRFYNVVVAVDSTKTKFQVAYQTYLWDVSTSDANTDGKYLWKIEGYLP